MEILKDFLNKFIQSCTNFNFFKNIIPQPVKTSFKFFLTLILLISIIVGFREGWLMSRIMEDVFNWANNNLPNMVIKDGRLSTEVEQPFKTMYEDIPILIDTTGEIQDLREYEKGVLIKEKKVVYKIPESDTLKFSFEKIKNLELTPDSINKIKKNLYTKIVPMTIIFRYIYFGIVKFMQIFLFSLLGMVINNIKHKGFSYKEILNISIYAFSPVALISIILGVLGVHTTITWLIYSGLFAFYLVGGIFYTESGLS